MDEGATARTVTRICPLCEATCGLEITLSDSGEGRGGRREPQVSRVRGDDEDVFSGGYACPKGLALGELHDDPARVRTPLVSDGGALRPATWDEAYARVREGLRSIVEAHGPAALGIYLGNPNVHNVESTFYVPALVRALATPYRFSASTVDQMPRQVAAALMFGTELSVPVPDIDRTDLFVVIGANPLVSNGSLMTAPDMPARLRALRARGGRLVVVDPVRTRTARIADVHLRPRPGTDAYLLAAIARRIFDRGPVLGAAAAYVDPDELASLGEALEPFTMARAAAITGIPADAIEALADEIAAAPSAAVYARMGTTTSAWWPSEDAAPVAGATVASWLVDVVALLSGNLDRPGGSMWPLPATGGPTTYGESGRGRGVRIPGARRTRVRSLPSVLGEFPASAMAEEIDTPDPTTGERIRAMLVVGGNPAVSTPHARRLAEALDSLDLLVSVDAYVTETNARADVVLPVPSPLERPHCDVVFSNLAVRNTVRFSPTAVESPVPDEGTTLLTLAAIAVGIATGSEPTPEQLDDVVAYEVARQIAATPSSPLAGREPADIVALSGDRRGAERLVDLSLRGGPHGLTLDEVLASPHGIDLGPLAPRLPEVLRTPSGRIDIVPPQIVGQLAALDAAATSSAPSAEGLVLVGRRQLRTSNSWLRNLPLLSGGSVRCTLLMHPDDAARRGLASGDRALLSSAADSVEVDVEVSDDLLPGVVSLPHGWGGASAPPVWGEIGRAAPGVNVNIVTLGDALDPLAGTAALNGVPVSVACLDPSRATATAGV